MEKVKILLHEGTDINIKNPKTGRNALDAYISFYEEEDEDDDIVTQCHPMFGFLLDNGIDVYAKALGEDLALSEALRGRMSVDCIKKLILTMKRQNIDLFNLNYTDTNGKTPLMYSFKYDDNNNTLTKFMIEQGADVNYASENPFPETKAHKLLYVVMPAKRRFSDTF